MNRVSASQWWGFVLIFPSLICLCFAGWMTQENFLNQSFEAFQQPSKIYWMGTDDLGRDLWTGVVQGLQNSLIIGLGVTLLAYSVGLLLGVTSGFFGGFTDTLILKLSEIIMVLPRFLIVILTASLLGQGVLILIITLGLFSWTTIYRIVRSEVLSLKRREYLSDNWNKYFIVCGVLIIISSLKNFFFTNSLLTNEFDPKLSLIGTLNWLPFFWLFWGFQPFLDSAEKRKATSIFLIAGTFPLIVSGFGQYFFNWTGPFELLNDLIIWYQRPIDTHGLTGPFNNQNYAGSWFSLVFPFCIALLLEKTKKIPKIIFSLFFSFSIGIAGILTNSRNAWASMISSIPLVIGFNSLYWYLPLIITIFTLIFLTAFQPLSGNFQDLLRELIPENIWLEFADESSRKLSVTRIGIFLRAFIGASNSI